jgi:predicted RNase H-like nuclease/ppGpp synthetase/RelA/SpoT-type nucleotidyltranferase
VWLGLGVYFVGVDLAWGDRKRTGLAVLDQGGALVHVSTVRDDAEILSALAPYVEGDCLVAFDAPLIVRNATGNRAAEAALNRDFARFDAGAHPVNTSKPELGTTPRGARLSSTMGLDLNPRSGRSRRAIEVYPHPATVSLLRLGRTLKYKSKTGRDVAEMRRELLTLMRGLESLTGAVPALVLPEESGWPKLVEAVDAATRKSELRLVEDQVDAVVCAYVALFATRAPERTTTYGSFEEGYIVTPTLPADLLPTPRTPRGTGLPASAISDPDSDPVREAVRAYAALQEELAIAGDQAITLVTTILDEAGINYLSVTGRIKSVESFAGKAARRIEGQLVYTDPLIDITDQIGVRVITYVQSDVIAVADLLHDQTVVKDDRDLGKITASQGRFGYASRHILLALDAAREGQAEYEQLHARLISVQVRTVLQHAWAEFEHDIRYKGTVPAEHASEFDRRFTLAAGLLELADREFSTIRDRLQSGPAAPTERADDDPRIEPRELAAFLAGQYADAGWSRTDHYLWISGLLLELGITSVDELSDVLRPVSDLDLNDRMAYKYPPGAVRRLDDALLAAFGDKYVRLHGNAHRAALLRQRLEKLTS